jgi:hypothetical protein
MDYFYSHWVFDLKETRKKSGFEYETCSGFIGHDDCAYYVDRSSTIERGQYREKTDEMFCGDFCSTEGYSGNGILPRNSGDRSYICYDNFGNEALFFLFKFFF